MPKYRKNVAPLVAAAAIPVAGDVAKVAVVPFFDIIKPVVWTGAGVLAVWGAKKLFVGRKTEALWSAPVLVGAAGSFAVGSALKMSDEAKVAVTVAGAGVGWMVQYFFLLPQEEAADIQAEQAQREADWRWYNPFSW